jgi:hypothetical protein
MDVDVNAVVFFLLKYSKGSPCCAKILLQRKLKSQNCTKGQMPNEPTKRKNVVPIYIYSQAAKKQSILGVLHSVGLKSCFIKEPNLP